MLLTGSYERALDDKLRFTLPKALRQPRVDDEVLYLTPGTDGSLTLYPESTFQDLARRLAVVSPTKRETRSFSRLFFSQAQRCDLDRQGRIRVPVELAQLAGLDKDITLIGVRDHIEVWDTVRWRAYAAGQLAQYDAIAESAFEGSSRWEPASVEVLPAGGVTRRGDASGGVTDDQGASDETRSRYPR